MPNSRPEFNVARPAILVALIAAGATVSAALIAVLLGKRKSSIEHQEIDPSEPIGPEPTIKKTETRTVRVVIQILGTGQKHEVEVPLDMKVSVLRKSLARKLHIPPISADGRVIEWRLRSATRKIVLGDSLSLSDNGVQEMELLVFYAEEVAG